MKYKVKRFHDSMIFYNLIFKTLLVHIKSFLKLVRMVYQNYVKIKIKIKRSLTKYNYICLKISSNRFNYNLIYYNYYYYYYCH